MAMYNQQDQTLQHKNIDKYTYILELETHLNLNQENNTRKQSEVLDSLNPSIQKDNDSVSYKLNQVSTKIRKSFSNE